MIIVGRPKHEIVKRTATIRQDYLYRYDSVKLRKQLFRQQEGICLICKGPMRDSSSTCCSVDHGVSIYIHASGAYSVEDACKYANDEKNLLAAHIYCNSVKNARDYEEFTEQLEARLITLDKVAMFGVEIKRLQRTEAAPAKGPIPRFHRPAWVADPDMFREFHQRLFGQRVTQHPTLAEFELSKTEIDCEILSDYFTDRLSYVEIWTKFSEPPSEFHDVSVEEAGDSIQGAMQFLARRNGALPIIKIRKANDKIYRAEMSAAIADHYYLPTKLNPDRKAGTRALQKYVSELVNKGYQLLKQAKESKRTPA